MDRAMNRTFSSYSFPNMIFTSFTMVSISLFWKQWVQTSDCNSHFQLKYKLSEKENQKKGKKLKPRSDINQTIYEIACNMACKTLRGKWLIQSEV